MSGTAKIFATIAAAKRGFAAARRAGFDLDNDNCTVCGLSVYPSARAAFDAGAAAATILQPRIHAPAFIRRSWWVDVALWQDGATAVGSAARGLLLEILPVYEVVRPTEVAALDAVRRAAAGAAQVRQVNVVDALVQDGVVGSLHVRDLWREVAQEMRQKHSALEIATARFERLLRQEDALRRMKRVEIGLRAAGLDFSASGTPISL